MSDIAEVIPPDTAATPRLARDNRYFDIKREIEEFLYDESNMLDERRFKEWLDTLAEDLRYFMPMEYNVKAGEHAKRELTKREEQMSWFNEGKWTLMKRAEQILTGVHWAEEPLSRVCGAPSNAAARSAGASRNAHCRVRRASDQVPWSPSPVTLPVHVPEGRARPRSSIDDSSS